MNRRDMLKYTSLAVSGVALAKFTDNLLTSSSTSTLTTAITDPVSTVISSTTSTLTSSTLTPILPQYDTLSGNLARRSALVLKQQAYVWTENFPNIVGIPMAAALPPNELPTIEWLIKSGSVFIDVMVNFLASIPLIVATNWQSQLDTISRNFTTSKNSYSSIVNANLNKTQLSPDVILTIQKIQLDLLSALTNLGNLVKDIAPHVNELFDQSNSDGLTAYKSLFVTTPLPAAANEFREDEYFANLRVAGPNPMLIKGISALPSNFPLTDAQYKQVMGSQDSLATAAASHRLYLLDYVDVGLMAPAGAVNKPLSGTGYAYAPIALFAIPIGGTSLIPVAIQCGQDPHAFPIVLPSKDTSSSAYWAWQMAKTAVQVAEENYHEMFVHLARTHLVTEVFCMATPRNLAPTHPLNILLMPHLEGSMFINELAALTLIEPNGFIDVMFSAPIEDIQATVGIDRLGFDFYAHMLPTDLANRKVDNVNYLPNYPFRDDGLLLWNAIAKWVKDYINIYYLSDADVVNDSELTAWANDVIANGKIYGFKLLKTKQQLIDVITMVIFTASAQHAAVNFTQPVYWSYSPATSAHSSAPAPRNDGTDNEQSWLAMMPSMLAAVETLGIYMQLGSVYYGKLGQYRSNTLPYLPTFNDTRVNTPLANFQTTLQQIEATITQRNQTRTRPYTFLLPSRIPQSTNI